MPTGYTAAVQDGKITDFREFALQCARAFGACVTMRDDPSDEPIPERFEPQTACYDEMIAVARPTLAELAGLSVAECERRAAAHYAGEIDDFNRYAQERIESRGRYDAMLKRAIAWHAPVECTELKAFMIDQLNESIRFDCSESYRPPAPTRLTGEEWRNKMLTKTSRDLAYATEEKRKEIERTDERNRWLTALRESL